MEAENWKFQRYSYYMFYKIVVPKTFAKDEENLWEKDGFAT